jgi:uncharacterized Zn finger protein
VPVIVSEGPRSIRRIMALPPGAVLRLGTRIPGLDEALLPRRIDGRDGRAVLSARADEVATVWATADAGAVIRVSVIEGATTRPARLVAPPTRSFTVGDEVTVDGYRLSIVALRARGRTWRRPGDAFSAAEVQRLYGRRTATPPAGSRDWRTDRETPRSRASSSSIRGRSRSSPGVTRTRTSPRARTAASGAAVQRSRPS